MVRRGDAGVGSQAPASEWQGDEYDALRGDFSRPKTLAYFQKGLRPGLVAARLAVIVARLGDVARVWTAEEGKPREERTREVMLRETLSDLGPVFVKIGQTLSQRSDLIGEDAAQALKKLQEQNKPFEDELAWRTIAEDLRWDGPLAPNHPYMREAWQAGAPTLFAELGDTHIAAASLGQVYRGRLHSGQEVAVKVQRPDVVRQVALDWMCWAAGLEALRRVWNVDTDLSSIADEVATGVWQELDYHVEASNSDVFRERHAFLGFVTSPRWYQEFTGPRGRARVLTMEWMDGKMLGELEPEGKLQLAQMAVEACVAQLVYTGFVHADPHEGNLMLLNDGRLCFLDFGLMSEVAPDIMEGFAKGIQNVLSEDWEGLAGVFQDVGFVARPPAKILPGGEVVECSLQEVATAVGKQLSTVEGGTSRFGALATGLTAMSGDFRFFTPPYIVLLIRTFLTLEGIAEKADPNFNIYEASMPYALKRAFAPATPEGEAALRAALLEADERGEFRLRTERITDALSAEAEAAVAEAKAGAADDAAAVSQQRGMDAMKGLAGERAGKSLRKVAYDADPVELSEWLASREAAAARRKAVHMLAELMAETFAMHTDALRGQQKAVASRKSRNGKAWPVSDEGRRIRERSEVNSRRAVRTIIGGQFRRLVRGGLPGLAALVRLAVVGTGVILRAAWLVMTKSVSRSVRGVLNRQTNIGGAASPA